MAKNRDIIEEREVAPEELLVVFSHGKIILWMAIAVVIHVIVIGVTSVSDIRDRLDPDGAKVRKEAAATELAKLKAAEKAAHALKTGGTNAPSSTATNTLSGTASNAAPESASNTVSLSTGKTNSVDDDTAIPASRTNSSVAKAIMSVASSNEIPKQSTLGVSLEDTQVR